MWFLAIVLAGLLLAIFRLTTRYQYGRKSQRLLIVDLVGSFALGLLLSHLYFFPTTSGVWLALAGLGVGLLIFVFAALITAEVLRKGRQSAFDDRLRSLRAREQGLLGDLEEINREMRAELARREARDAAGEARRRRLERDREKVERWQHEGGAARIRSIKVEEWQTEFRGLDEASRAARRAEFERELAAGPEPERRGQVEVMLALLALSGEGDEAAGPGPGDDSLDGGISSLAERRRRVEADLAATRAEIVDWQKRLSDFLSREIDLG